ncbi:MAG: hypothetical protein JJU29_05190 [Verrucomicrobia bacterium]|nr:hypothetical protein [Verrucomicrobiota bacterium]MCH8514049.1 hypothetical protein [Kiritimatiellia bacterium]
MVLSLHGAVGPDDLCGAAAASGGAVGGGLGYPGGDWGDPVLAGEQAAVLRDAYDRIDNFRDAVSFLFTLEYVDRQITLTATGGLLTILSQAGRMDSAVIGRSGIFGRMGMEMIEARFERKKKFSQIVADMGIVI